MTNTQEIALERPAIDAVSLVVSLVAFAVPFFVSGPQWLTGTLVNTLLFLVAAKVPAPRRAVILLPGIAAVLHGVVFGPFTPFLAFFLPFIWLGNGVLVQSSRILEGSLPWSARIIVSAVLKSALLFLSALLYVRLGIVPSLFLASMGLMQLFTALAGGVIAFAVLSLSRSARS